MNRLFQGFGIQSLRCASAAYIPIKSIKLADKAYRDLYSHIADICDRASDMDRQNPKTTEMTIMGNIFPL